MQRIYFPLKSKCKFIFFSFIPFSFPVNLLFPIFFLTKQGKLLSIYFPFFLLSFCTTEQRVRERNGRRTGVGWGVIRKLEHIPVMQVRDQSDILSINPYQHQTGHGAMVIPDSPYWFLVLALYRILTKQSIQIMQTKEKKDIWAYSTWAHLSWQHFSCGGFLDHGRKLS